MAGFIIKTLFDLIGRSVCHRIPKRSFAANGLILPVCARCTGIYIGVFVSFFYIAAVYHKTRRNDDKTDLITVIVCAACFIPLALDGSTSFLLLRESNNLLRLITGILAGYILPLFIAFANGKPFLKKREICIILIISACTAFLTYRCLINYYLISSVLCAGVVLLVCSAVGMVVKLTR